MNAAVKIIQHLLLFAAFFLIYQGFSAFYEAFTYLFYCLSTLPLS